jgi:hypothetical protein
VNLFYSITLTVSAEGSFLSSFSTVTVYVGQGNIIIVIKNGLTRNIKVGSSIVIDAENSYDEDYPEILGKDLGLIFMWTCSQLSPIFSLNCSSTLNISMTNFIIGVNANLKSQDTSNEITLTIHDLAFYRVSQAVVIVHVLPVFGVLISVDTNLISRKMNSDQLLQISGKVETTNFRNLSAFWRVEDKSIDLQSISLSSITQKLHSGVTSTYLVISPNSLNGGSFYQFFLTCTVDSFICLQNLVLEIVLIMVYAFLSIPIPILLFWNAK